MSASIQSRRALARPVRTASCVAARKSIDAGRFFATEADVFYGKIIAADLQLPGVIAASASPELAQRLQAERGAVDRHRVRLTRARPGRARLPRRHGQPRRSSGRPAPSSRSRRQSLQDFQRLGTRRALRRRWTRKLAAPTSPARTGRAATSPTCSRAATPTPTGPSRLAQRRQPAHRVDGRHRGPARHRHRQCRRGPAERRSSSRPASSVPAPCSDSCSPILLAAVLAQRITLPLRRLTLAAG